MFMIPKVYVILNEVTPFVVIPVINYIPGVIISFEIILITIIVVARCNVTHR